MIYLYKVFPLIEYNLSVSFTTKQTNEYLLPETRTFLVNFSSSKSSKSTN